MIDSLITSVVYAMKDDFLRNIKWHLLFCEFCGLLHFSCTIPKTKLSKLTYIWPMFLLLTYLLIVYHGCIDMINNSFIDVEHNILATTDIFSSAFCIFDHIFTIAFYLVRRKDFTNILLEINAIDINFKRHRLKSLIICALLIIVVSIEELTTLSKYSVYYVLTYSINAYSNIVEQLLIYEVTREIKSKVEYLNDYLLILLKQYEFDGQMEITYANFCIRRNKKYASIEKEIESMREEHRTKFFQHVFKIIITHKKLTHIALNANKLFGIRLLFIALLNLIIPIFTLQYMYHSTHGHGSQGLISYTTWTSVLFCVFVINTNSWVSVANEVCKLFDLSFVFLYQ